ncbi:MAG TPA: 2,3-bisphosphoglycerate-independent phosphoglycerate mutase [Candidatus Rifleibacterium sp.]|nr:2,3-bisphosphoglycerate-independent phosphoglycerate mutase [Candidatus Rifleibacterium sp.]HPT44430.1 2,3-bisphosphoglycerate-independent phosphoglycerate mutase [Candidatus Rifleibacterium sp.]
MESTPKVLLIILDGFGLSDKTEGNAVFQANPEFINKLFAERPFTRLGASGLDVGLPVGQMGNSEVGHLNIGAGRVVYQDITRINRAIEDGSFFENKAMTGLIDQVKASGKALHLYGLVSDGGVHSHLDHIVAVLKLAKIRGLDKVFIHAFTDGRDTSPTSGVHFIRELVEQTAKIGVGRLASISGRYYAMDRDNRWERVEKAYLAIVHGVGNRASDAVVAMEASYKVNVTDEFVVPVVIEENGRPVATIDDGDAILAFNFRADRMRQLTRVFTAPEFNEFKRKEMKVDYLSFTHYSDEFTFPEAFPAQRLDDVLGSLLAKKGIAQLRLAETEKYAHVTYFTNGGYEPPFSLEDRHMVASPKVKTYDLKPEMSAFEVNEYLVEKLKADKYPFIMVNFANCDMVGHTGIMDAAIKAVNTVDCVLAKTIPLAYELGYNCLITADHGNVEQMVDDETGEAFTEHTVNPVPFCLLSRSSVELRTSGKLCDIAPTVLELMGIEKPEAMTGRSLIARKK